MHIVEPEGPYTSRQDIERLMAESPSGTVVLDMQLGHYSWHPASTKSTEYRIAGPTLAEYSRDADGDIVANEVTR